MFSITASETVPGAFRVVDSYTEPAEAVSARLARELLAQIDALEAIVEQLENDVLAGTFNALV